MSARALLLLPLLLLTLAPPAFADKCNRVEVNNKGSSGAPITIDNTAGGVTIVDANEARCGFTIVREDTNGIRCAPSSGKSALTVTTTVGTIIPASTYPSFGEEGKQTWKCIRTGGSSAVVNILEEMP